MPLIQRSGLESPNIRSIGANRDQTEEESVACESTRVIDPLNQVSNNHDLHLGSERILECLHSI